MSVTRTTVPTSAPTSASWPSGTPTWMQGVLDTMAAQGQLGSVPPQALAAIAKGESGYEVQGAGINSSGYGGFFGLGAGAAYTTPSGPMGVTATALRTSGQASFRQQAGVTSGLLAHLLGQEGTTLVRAIQAFGNGPGTLPTGKPGGTVPTIDSKIYEQTVAGGASTARINFPGTNIPLTGPGAIGAGVGAGASVAGSSITNFLAKALLIAAGIGLILIGAHRAASPHTKTPDLESLAAMGVAA